MALLDLLGRRWALRILWEVQGHPVTFRELRERCDAVSPTVLNQRLAELREAGIVGLRDRQGYLLTEEGESLIHALSPLSDWAKRWGKRPRSRRRVRE